MKTYLYEALIQKLPLEEKRKLVEDYPKLYSPETVSRGVALFKTSYDTVVWKNFPKMARLAFIGYQQNQISCQYIATLHFVMAAWKELIQHPVAYYGFRYGEHHNFMHCILYPLPLPERGKMSHAHTFFWTARYDAARLYYGKEVEEKDLPLLVQKIKMTYGEKENEPLLKRCFDFNSDEWELFLKLMEKEPEEEKKIYAFKFPEWGCLSPLLKYITSQLLKIMQPVKAIFCAGGRGELRYTEAMVIPSFSALQNYLNVKAYGVKRTPMKLIPTFGELSAEDVEKMKRKGESPLGLYYGAANSRQTHHIVNKHLKKIDVHPGYAFTFGMHDFYHAVKEQQITENITKARFRVLDILKEHFQKNPSLDSVITPIIDLLIDGELIFCYGVETCPFYTFKQYEPFGHIFLVAFYAKKARELIPLVIEDMVKHKNMWRERFGIGPEDLLESEQRLYRELEKKMVPAAV